jgi:hypothetical protein
MPLLETALAFTLAMLAASLFVSAGVEGIQRIGKYRTNGLKDMMRVMIRGFRTYHNDPVVDFLPSVTDPLDDRFVNDILSDPVFNAHSDDLNNPTDPQKQHLLDDVSADDVIGIVYNYCRYYDQLPTAERPAIQAAEPASATAPDAIVAAFKASAKDVPAAVKAATAVWTYRTARHAALGVAPTLTGADPIVNASIEPSTVRDVVDLSKVRAVVDPPPSAAPQTVDPSAMAVVNVAIDSATRGDVAPAADVRAPGTTPPPPTPGAPRTVPRASSAPPPRMTVTTPALEVVAAPAAPPPRLTATDARLAEAAKPIDMPLPVEWIGTRQRVNTYAMTSNFASYLDRWFSRAEQTATTQFRNKMFRLTTLVSAVVVLLFNLDGIQLLGDLYNNTQGRAALIQQTSSLQATANRLGVTGSARPAGVAPDSDKELLQELQKTATILDQANIGLGWQNSQIAKRWCAYRGLCSDSPPESCGRILLDTLLWFAGLIFSFVMLSLGAPFWYRVLLSIVNVGKGGGDSDKKGNGGSTTSSTARPSAATGG